MIKNEKEKREYNKNALTWNMNKMDDTNRQ